MASEEYGNENTKNLVATLLRVTSTISQTPFVHPFTHPFARVLSCTKSNDLVSSSAIHFGEVGRSIASVADEFLALVRKLVSENPAFKRICLLSSEFYTLCAQFRNHSNRKMSPLACHNFAAVLPGDSLAGVVAANGILNFLNIYNTLLVVRLILTWFPSAPSAIVNPLSSICDPYLNIFRGLIPPLGGTLDLSPILAFIVLNAFTSTASALPAELPVTEKSDSGAATKSLHPNLTASQTKWIIRLQGSQSKTSPGV